MLCEKQYHDAECGVFRHEEKKEILRFQNMHIVKFLNESENIFFK